MENRHYTSKYIGSLNINGEEIQDQVKILDGVKVKGFYEELYKSNDDILNYINLQDILHLNTPRLDEDRSRTLIGDISIEEAEYVKQ